MIQNLQTILTLDPDIQRALAQGQRLLFWNKIAAQGASAQTCLEGIVLGSEEIPYDRDMVQGAVLAELALRAFQTALLGGVPRREVQGAIQEALGALTALSLVVGSPLPRSKGEILAERIRLLNLKGVDSERIHVPDENTVWVPLIHNSTRIKVITLLVTEQGLEYLGDAQDPIARPLLNILEDDLTPLARITYQISLVPPEHKLTVNRDNRNRIRIFSGPILCFIVRSDGGSLRYTEEGSDGDTPRMIILEILHAEKSLVS